LNQLNFDISAGEHIGIIGPSGAGKSTILMLILGILKPTQGKISISEQDPEIYFNTPFSKVGYVGPEPFLIKGSIRSNLLYGIKFNVTDEDIWNALKMASLSDYIKSISLDYEIPEDQSGLSAGQKQRLCLARAFLNRPQLLVLDEATANLDDKTESEVALAVSLLKGKCTTVIVSHRPGILTYVDKTINLG
jgi:ATP-binding cassette subfamily B protein AbcA/BmrA